jgi:hypothetical protein
VSTALISFFHFRYRTLPLIFPFASRSVSFPRAGRRLDSYARTISFRSTRAAGHHFTLRPSPLSSPTQSSPPALVFCCLSMPNAFLHCLCVCLRIWPQSCVVWLPVARFFLWFFCCSNQIEPGSPDLDSSSFDFASSYCVWIVTGTHLSIAFESSDQKTWEFVVQIALSRWFSEHAYQVFGEMSVRI